MRFKLVVMLLIVPFLLISVMDAKNIHLKGGFSVLTYGFTAGAEVDIQKFHIEAGGFTGIVDEGFYINFTRSVGGDFLKLGGQYKSLKTHDELLTFGLAEEETEYNVIGGVIEVSIFRKFFLKPYLRGEVMSYNPVDEGRDSFTGLNVCFGISI